MMTSDSGLLQFALTDTLHPAHAAEAQLDLPPLPIQRPVLLIGHGSRDAEGRQSLLDFAAAYQAIDASRPVVPCFLELTEPTIQQGVDHCIELGYTELSALPILLFAARHNKFDVTSELDRAKQRHPQLKFHYGRHFGITPGLIDLWRDRLAALDAPALNPAGIDRQDTVLLFVGRGASDPDANGDVFKMARVLWEGSGYHTVETCFVGITHPRLEEGFRRARLYQPKRIIVLPYFLFTGALVKKIFNITVEQQAQHPEISMVYLPEMGLHPQLFQVLRQREIETQLGQVQMNCEMCKYRLAVPVASHGHGLHSHGSHDHGSHSHDSHSHETHSHETHSHETHSHDSHSHETHSHDSHSHETHSHAPNGESHSQGSHTSLDQHSTQEPGQHDSSDCNLADRRDADEYNQDHNHSDAYAHNYEYGHSRVHSQGHAHGHEHSHAAIDPYADLAQYHQKIWRP